MERSRIASKPTPQRTPSPHINYHSTASPKQPAAPCTSPPQTAHSKYFRGRVLEDVPRSWLPPRPSKTPSLPNQQLSSKLDSTSTGATLPCWTAPDDESAFCCEPWVTKGSKSHKSTCLYIQKKVWKSVGIFSKWKSRWEISPKTHLNHRKFLGWSKTRPKNLQSSCRVNPLKFVMYYCITPPRN